MAKSKERLDAEKNHQMNTKEKLANFWFYYRWWVMGGGVALVMAIMFIMDIGSNVKPDYTIGLLSQYMVPQTTIEAMEAAVLPYIDDRNGDGKTVVYLSAYTIATGDDTQSVDPMAHAANMTRLSGDMQMGESMLFITDNVSEYQKTFELFAYNDGTAPPAEGDIDFTRLGVPLSACPPLATLNMDGTSPGEFVLVKRTIAPEQLARHKGQTEYHGDSMRLFDSLIGR